MLSIHEVVYVALGNCFRLVHHCREGGNAEMKGHNDSCGKSIIGKIGRTKKCVNKPEWISGERPPLNGVHPKTQKDLKANYPIVTWLLQIGEAERGVNMKRKIDPII